MHKFKCPNGHEFEAKRSFHAHCPICGKNAQRIYDAEDNPRPTPEEKAKETTTDSTDSEKPKEAAQEAKDGEGDNSDGEQAERNKEQVNKDRPNPSKPRRVKVTRETPKKETATESKDKSPTSTPAKKVKIKRGAAPKVIKKIVTTRDRKVNQEKKEERATQWNRVRSFRIF